MTDNYNYIIYPPLSHEIEKESPANSEKQINLLLTFKMVN